MEHYLQLSSTIYIKSTHIYFSFTINYEYVTFLHSVSDLLPLKILSKDVVDNLDIKNENVEFVSRFTVYEDNNGAIIVEISPSMTTILRKIAVKYHWFRQHVGK